jgi:hypothetical protein
MNLRKETGKSNYKFAHLSFTSLNYKSTLKRKGMMNVWLVGLEYLLQNNNDTKVYTKYIKCGTKTNCTKIIVGAYREVCNRDSGHRAVGFVGIAFFIALHG